MCGATSGGHDRLVFLVLGLFLCNHQFCLRYRLEILSWRVENLERKLHTDVHSFDNRTP